MTLVVKKLNVRATKINDVQHTHEHVFLLFYINGYCIL